MFKKEFRLPKNVKFDKKYQAYSNFFAVKIAENSTGLKRFGVVVSKNIDKRAVGRNRIKRQIRRCIEENEKNLSSGKDILVIARPGIRDKETKEISEELKRIFAKIK
ncbi:MAG: ribonuclease P protein component [Candidatus Levybacteria bacterium RIFCSPLOWO2_02_FULL_37_10]|nr:MAG: ribonuclease P protein component [Candidatus Levybacteria bacterium RIFCSPHIGHO2_01_FULL_37_33]OGH16663.1 MAG: ribonuclease P protein component [Candidatus Levybacteria bacterium RIFCSPHIGHO2_02_FULL_37_11]OGH29355.1 MAG: ribonuclease P protein component [Candidatus Levybacteria bacterium RIFCSPHIGHO2_12_FULL_37_12]OGH32489.1 MAG: ribonuclease P protein component [Candidatus Levybacteria bacterium RIFCSPLOWO2_01_FULL_36_54]OGH45765.1 MAG: ribonuclease P protein component [Candidatus Lev